MQTLLQKNVLWTDKSTAFLSPHPQFTHHVPRIKITPPTSAACKEFFV